jgi:hypothetical protein
LRKKLEPKPKLTDAERHKRFTDMAREVEASEEPEDFEKAFKKVSSGKPSHLSSGGGTKRKPGQ